LNGLIKVAKGNGNTKERWGPARLIGRINCLICGGPRLTGINLYINKNQFSNRF